MRRLIVIMLFTSCVAAPAAAHDLWLEPSMYRAPAAGTLTIRLMVGDDFRGEAVARNDRRIERFVIRDAAGERPVTGRHGGDPAGTVAVRERPAVLGYRSTPIRHRDVSAARFESYLREEGLERIIDIRRSTATSAAPGKEIYSRSAKTLLRAADGASSQAVREPLGFRFEIVPESNPFDSDEPLRIRVLFEGAPVVGVLVSAARAGDPRPITARSDSDGLVELPLGDGGIWLVRSVHMIEAPAGSDADWESIWASMTFQRGP